MSEIIRLDPAPQPTGSPLSEYLARRERELVRFNGTEIGESEYADLASELDRHFARLSGALANYAQFSELVLGRVQSGKTSHIIATIAWAAEQGFDAVAIVTGLTEELKEQTLRRLRRDLERLPSSPVKLLDVPTLNGRSGGPFHAALNEVLHATNLRSSSGSLSHPMPVLVVLKKPQRVEAMTKLLSHLTEAKPDSRILLIDDEADQASPNAGVRNSTLSATYEALGDARSRIGSHILLSYTATPQAILAQPALNSLRPDVCLVVPPGRGYFGLADLLASDFGGRRQVDDGAQMTNGVRPSSLDKALATFFVCAAIRRLAPEFFYASRPEGVDVSRRMESVQFLLHPSGRQADHALAHRFVTEFQREVVAAFESNQESLYAKLFRPAYREWRQSLPPDLARRLDPEPTDNFCTDVVRSIASGMQIRVINSDPAAPTDTTLPEDDDAWESSQAWILIGGNILGRGITIPQLITKYFLRSPQAPQFDTTNQQMRICGYRADYRHMITQWAPPNVWARYVEINEIDQVVLSRAQEWDRRQTSLKDRVPSIVYLARSSARVSPTRRSVIDPRITDHDLSGRMFQTRAIASPRRLLHNLPQYRQFIGEIDPADWTSDGFWDVVHRIDTSLLAELFRTLSCSVSEKHVLSQIVDLMSVYSPELGLQHVPFSLFVSERTLFSKPAARWTRDDPRSIRASNAHDLKVRLTEDWEEVTRRYATQGLMQPDTPFEAIRIDQFFGQEHVNLARSLPYEAVSVFVQPMAVAPKARSESRIAAGIALGLIAPPNFSVRAIGHEQ